MFAINRHAAVALFLGIMKIRMPAARMKHRVFQLLYLCPGFLDTNNIGLLTYHPLEEAFFGGGTNAVYVDRDNAHVFPRINSACMIAIPASHNDP